jgi:hypothetical protein
MTIHLQQSTASQIVPLGPFVDETDGDTAETQLNIANTDIKLWKRGATSLVNKNSGGATHMSGGVYYATFNATDTNTLGPLYVYVNVSGALPVKERCEVLTTADYEARYNATAVSPYVAAPGHTWVFTSGNQLTAANTVEDIAGSFDDLVVAMDFSGVLGSGNSIATVVSSAVADETGETEPTIVSATKRADGKAVVLILDGSSATAATYTVTVTITTSDSQQLARKGYLELATA